MSKSINLTGMWMHENKAGKEFYSSSKMTFGELRNLLKDFKDSEDVSNTDNVIFYLFPCNYDNAKAPKFHLNIKKDDFDPNGNK